MRQPFIAAVAALSLVLFGAAGPGFGETAPQERKPAIVLAPPPGEPAAEVPNRQPPPIARKKPPPPKKASVPKRAAEKAPAKKAPAKKAPAKKSPATKAQAKKAPAQAPPARAAVSPAPGKDCDYCYGCESLAAVCKRQWVCGRKYTERLAAGLCRR